MHTCIKLCGESSSQWLRGLERELEFHVDFGCDWHECIGPTRADIKTRIDYCYYCGCCRDTTTHPSKIHVLTEPSATSMAKRHIAHVCTCRCTVLDQGLLGLESSEMFTCMCTYPANRLKSQMNIRARTGNPGMKSDLERLPVTDLGKNSSRSAFCSDLASRQSPESTKVKLARFENLGKFEYCRRECIGVLGSLRSVVWCGRFLKRWQL